MSGPKILLFLAALVLIASGCVRPGPADASPFPPTPVASSIPTQIPEPSPTTAPTPSPITQLIPPTTYPADSGWEPIRPGLERRAIEVRSADGVPLEKLFILRLTPDAFTFDIGYLPSAQPLETWLSASGALIALNGGYYRAEGETLIPTGLTIVNGEAIGESYGSFAGMLAMSDAGASLRWLAQSPYDPAEHLRAALQSFPLLVKPGGEMGFPAEAEDYQPARRTVIAQDRGGNFLLMVAPLGYFTLHQLSAYLVESDLDLDIALNLDGGPSSGLLIADPRQGETALLPLPVVILVYARE